MNTGQTRSSNRLQPGRDANHQEIRHHAANFNKFLGELARLGGFQKYLLMQIKGLPDEEGLRRELNSTLSAVLSAVRMLNTAAVK